MNFDEPSTEIDLAVAEAVGIKVGQWPGGWPYHGAVYRKDDTPAMQRSFCPSRDMTDAWEAAEKVGLFSDGNPQYWLSQSLDAGGPWVVAYLGGAQDDVSWEYLADAPTAPLAICGAILELSGTGR